MSKVIEVNLEINLRSKESIGNATGSRILKINPDIAELWLSKFNGTNRPLIENHSKELARRMSADQWRLNGETIKFNQKGEMIDGQHRCRAIVIHSKPVEIEVRFGLGNIFETLDEGKKRSPGDVLAIEGTSHYTNIAAAIGFIVRHNNGNNVVGSRMKSKISNRDVLDFYHKHAEKLEEYVRFGNKLYDLSGRFLSASEFTAYMYLFSEKHATDASKFLEKLAIGANLERTSPIFHLRAKLMQSKMDKQKSLNARVKKALIIKAWNAYRKDNEMKILKFDPERESYPEIL